MKKEKKAVIKNSEYYYKKCDGKGLAIRFFSAGILSIIAMTMALKHTTADYKDKELLIMQESGYNEYIESEKQSLEDKRESNEISQNVYEAYLEDLNNETLKGYLKKTDNIYYLAEYEKNEKDKTKSSEIITGSAVGFVFTWGISEMLYFYYKYNKAKKLRVLETEEKDKKEIDDFNNFIKKNGNLLDNVQENSYTELE